MSTLESKRVLFFDTETLSLNPYEKDINDNSYGFDAKIITTQVFAGGVMTIEKEWELGEKKLLENFLFRFDRWANNFRNRKFMPVITYHGIFDILYILGRMNQNNFPESDVKKMTELFMTMKHIDLMQYDNGYLISLDDICNKYKINAKCEFSGKDIKRLYHEGRFNDIVAHGEDDVNRLKRLANETRLADRFFIDKIGIFDDRKGLVNGK